MSFQVAADSSVNTAHVSRAIKLYDGRTAPVRLHILIVGCGLGGLAAAHALSQAGHRVTMFETAGTIGEVGAGIQVTPNVTRLLNRWGLAEPLAGIAVKPEGIVFRRYSNGERVGYTQWGEKMSEHGANYYHIHRADFHKLLFDLAAPNMTLRLKSTVVAVDPDTPSVTLKCGEVVKGDVLIGADGVKSYVQTVVLGYSQTARATGDAAYRATIPTSIMLADPDLRSFVEHPEMTAWMAPGRHLMGYCIRAAKEYNMVLLHPDDGSVESWNTEGSADKMRADFADFEPRVLKMLSHVQGTLKWRLMDRLPLPTWIHPSGKVALLGDSCHPMLPYRAQGAAMAIEDAAVLGNLFSRITHKSQIPTLLRGYQDIRLERTANTQRSARLNQKIFHYDDGPEQEQRDTEMRAAMEAELKAMKTGVSDNSSNEGNANQWADKKKNAIQFGYDADLEAEKWWSEVGQQQVQEVAHL